MLTIRIWNDKTGTNESANYNYGVYVNYRKIDSGRVEGHNRGDDWDVLVEQIVREKNETELRKLYKGG